MLFLKQNPPKQITIPTIYRVSFVCRITLNGFVGVALPAGEPVSENIYSRSCLCATCRTKTTPVSTLGLYPVWTEYSQRKWLCTVPHIHDDESHARGHATRWALHVNKNSCHWDDWQPSVKCSTVAVIFGEFCHNFDECSGALLYHHCIIIWFYVDELVHKFGKLMTQHPWNTANCWW